ncbi:hypothetical protein ACHAW5_002071 [Stephanodiscus triporus]|uniref:serine C-palmitoyltransferase n=1 Tax=Stephanodiscus triporus TaxID=2934178 RepID=A0ABD3MTN4_9STRA
MTGKFTQHVHDLGYATGRTLRRLFPLASRDGVSSSWPLSGGAGGGLFERCYRDIVARTVSSGVGGVGVDPPSASSLLGALDLLMTLPNRYRIWWLNLLRSDPLHVLVETLLIVMCIALVILQRRADWRFGQERKKFSPTREEEEELICEWKSEKRKPLGGGGGRRGDGGGGAAGEDAGPGTGLVVAGIAGSRLLLVREDDDDYVAPSSSSALNLATLDPLSSSSSSALRDVARRALSRYGCGSCGPRGFYGTIDAHLEVERAMADFLGTEGAILYSDGASASTSTVAAFAKRGDLLIVDEGVNEALLVGVTLSRANVRYFRHNNVRDLRRVLEKVASQDEACGRRSTDQRRFLVVEGLYRNWGTIAPLDEIVKLKEEFHYRLILDDSHGIGALGNYGRGSLEYHGLRHMEHAEIVTFSLEYSLGSVGGMTVGSEEVVDHQRLSGAGYCFSASAPPFLAKVCLASIRRLEGRLDEMMKEIGNVFSDDGVVKMNREQGIAAMIGDDELNVNDMKVADLRIQLRKRGLNASGRKVELQERLNDHLSSSIIRPPSLLDNLSGPALLERLHQNVSNLYGTLTNSSHPHALKLRDRLVITSHPHSPILYLRLADAEAIGRTRVEQTCILDQISRHCLVKGQVAIVSTGGHVKKYLQLVPEPCLRLVANVSQTLEDVETFVKALVDAVESVLVHNDGNVME